MAQFHQRSTYSFYTHRSRKSKKLQLSHKYIFTLLGSTSVKAVRRMLMKLTPERKLSRIIISLKVITPSELHPRSKKYVTF